MPKRFVTIWFCQLKTDWLTLRRPALKNVPFVFASPDHGRMIITAANIPALKQGISPGMALADARAIVSSLQYFDDNPELPGKLLLAIGRWCIRYAPGVAVDLPDGLILDSSGCAHLWGGEQEYITGIRKRFESLGYTIRVSMADTIGAAWAVTRFGQNEKVVANKKQAHTIHSLPPEALRLENETVERLYKLGLRQVERFMHIPRSSLRRRFGQQLLVRLDQALDHTEENIIPIHQPEPYSERVQSLDYILTATGIKIALENLLQALCKRLIQEEKGLRAACFTCYRTDGKKVKIEIGTLRPSQNATHLFKLFELKIDSIQAEPGIELFILTAPVVEDLKPLQEKIWNGNCGMNNTEFAELMDRIAGKIGGMHIHRYLPDEHYLPERSIRKVSFADESTSSVWPSAKQRPVRLLAKPVPIEVTAPIPDYPPMHFRYKGKLHTIKKADGPERIEAEWWIEEGMHRDYYAVEDEDGNRYWLFRAGHYTGDNRNRWFIHGFFA